MRVEGSPGEGGNGKWAVPGMVPEDVRGERAAWSSSARKASDRPSRESTVRTVDSEPLSGGDVMLLLCALLRPAWLLDHVPRVVPLPLALALVALQLPLVDEVLLLGRLPPVVLSTMENVLLSECIEIMLRRRDRGRGTAGPGPPAAAVAVAVAAPSPAPAGPDGSRKDGGLGASVSVGPVASGRRVCSDCDCEGALNALLGLRRRPAGVGVQSAAEGGVLGGAALETPSLCGAAGFVPETRPSLAAAAEPAEDEVARPWLAAVA